MWIFMNDSFVSIVEDQNVSGGEPLAVSFGNNNPLLLVRARRRNDLVVLFPQYAKQIKRTPNADYRWRIHLFAKDVIPVIAARIAGIDYGNFKDSVKEKERKAIYSRVWHEHLQLENAEAHLFREPVSQETAPWEEQPKPTRKSRNKRKLTKGQ